MNVVVEGYQVKYDKSTARQTPTSTYQHMEKSSPCVSSPTRITPSEWPTRVQAYRHLEAVESEDSGMLTAAIKTKGLSFPQCCILYLALFLVAGLKVEKLIKNKAYKLYFCQISSKLILIILSSAIPFQSWCIF